MDLRNIRRGPVSKRASGGLADQHCGGLDLRTTYLIYLNVREGRAYCQRLHHRPAASSKDQFLGHGVLGKQPRLTDGQSCPLSSSRNSGRTSSRSHRLPRAASLHD